MSLAGSLGIGARCAWGHGFANNSAILRLGVYALPNIRVRAERSVVSGSAAIEALRHAT